jgi:hypothetical protein
METGKLGEASPVSVSKIPRQGLSLHQTRMKILQTIQIMVVEINR